MRMHWVLSFAVVLSGMLIISSFVNDACAGQVVTDAVRQWAEQAVKAEASLKLEPAANTVAVLYFQNRTRQPRLDFLQKGMAVLLITDLSKLQTIQVVERTQVQALVQELKLGASGLVAKGTEPRMGRLLGARYLVGGTINPGNDDTFTIDSNLLNVPQDGIVGSPSGSGTLARLLSVEKEILFEIVRLLQLQLTETQKAELRKPVTTSIKALMFLVRGINGSDDGAYERAADNYRKALQIDPGLAPARSALGELRAMGLIGAGPGNNALLYNLRKRVSVNQGPIPDQITKRRDSEPASVLGPAGDTTGDVRVQW